MDSNRYGVFLIAIFLFAVASFVSSEEPSGSSHQNDNATLSEILNSATDSPSVTSKKDSHTSTTKSSANETSVPEKTESVSTTMDSSSATKDSGVPNTSTTAPKENTTPSSSDSSTSKVAPSKEEGSSKTEDKPAIETKPLVVTNSQNVREVETTKCSTGYQSLSKDSLIPEKVILNVNEVSVSAVQFCDHSSSIMQLNTTCSTDADAESSGVKVAPIAAGLAALFSSVCSNPSATLPALGTNGSQCSDAIVKTTKKCTASMKSSYSYPSEMFYHEIMISDCAMLKDAKACIAKGMEQSCSSAQQEAVSNLMTSMLKFHQCTSTESGPAMKAEPSSNAATTTAPHHSTPGNSGANIQMSIFTILPALALAFKFY